MHKSLKAIVITAIIIFHGLAASVLVQAQPSGGDEVKRILSKMTVEEKVGQIMLGFFEGASLSPELKARIVNNNLGGVILYSSAGNIESNEQVARLVEDIQKTAVASNKNPLFISIDQEGGRVARLTDGATVFPGNMALGATGDEELARKSAAITARELRALGINLNFAPSVDVNSNPANPIIGVRSFGSSPEDVARLGSAMLDGYRAAGVIATAKHFPGHGDTNIDSHVGLPVVLHNIGHLNRVELLPFQAMIKAGVPAVMTAHVVLPAIDDSGVPATLSPKAMNMLRERMGFEGIIFTDSMSMGAIVNNYGMEEAAIRAFLAGADVLLFGADSGHVSQEQDVIYKALLRAVQAGRISEERLNQSVRRILKAKAEYGILDNPYPNNNYQAVLAAPHHLTVAEEIAGASLTLVKNNNLLNLDTTKPVPIIWPQEYEAELALLLAECPFLKPAIISLKPDGDTINKICETLSKEEVVLVGTYDIDRNPEWAKLVQALGADKVIALAMRSPYDLLKIPEVGAYIACYSDRPVTMKALGKLLKGELEPRGYLPVELTGLYLRGWGLTKTFTR
ncbi:MAG: beta-N-acetylhexosaminidase [Veillonellaceae bacterium]|jgi:beta-N-acetylhexosaminidase|nr:beta-N-acetylhexosaminidase [Veillonellaceae bacterium]